MVIIVLCSIKKNLKKLLTKAIWYYIIQDVSRGNGFRYIRGVAQFG